MFEINVNEIKWLMIEKGFSLNKLSKESKLSKSTLSRLINNKCKSRPITINKIAKVLGVSPRKLYLKDKI